MPRFPLLPALVLLFPFAACAGSADRSTVARVNSEAISADEVSARLREYQANLKGEPSPEAKTFRDRVLNELIEERILLAEAEARNIEVTPDELRAALQEIEKDYPSGSFAKVLSEKRMTYARWRDRMKTKLTLNKVVAALTKEISPPSEAAVLDYYRKNEESFRRPEQVRVSQIVVRTPEDGKRILDELKKGKPFEMLARTYSFTPEAGQGGDLGFVEKGVLPASLEGAFWKLAAGKTTPVIPSEYGYHVVRVTERKPEHVETVDEARPRIVKVLTEREREDVFAVWRRNILGRARIEKNHALLDQIR
jgi:parvulin-like peptidyl-prolyl isomerase